MFLCVFVFLLDLHCCPHISGHSHLSQAFWTGFSGERLSFNFCLKGTVVCLHEALSAEVYGSQTEEVSCGQDCKYPMGGSAR